jgi:hypothetical protein
MQSFQDSEEMFHEVNPGVAFLSFEEYVEKTPLLFLKDYWGRWVALGEYQILLPGGCGKPVIYLYPTQPTEVTVKLLSPTRFSVDVPKYDPVKGWRVLALPNGDLIDQQPDLTSCDQFVSNRFGLEYAAEACQAQTYPYLYWAGSVIDQTYLQPSTGWVVEKKDLEKFFKDKLSKMGFIEQEMNEFNKYWIPQMSSHPELIFRISFLQTDELNQLFPMAVEPTPKSMLRMFLDYQPLQKYPSQLPIPQALKKVERSGFTLVEWGGLKR